LGAVWLSRPRFTGSSLSDLIRGALVELHERIRRGRWVKPCVAIKKSSRTYIVVSFALQVTSVGLVFAFCQIGDDITIGLFLQ
jgi:hypothetical protein